MDSSLYQWSDPRERAIHWKLTVTDHDLITMDREQLEMIRDGLWLIEQALRANTEGALRTPRLRLPVRT